MTFRHDVVREAIAGETSAAPAHVAAPPGGPVAGDRDDASPLRSPTTPVRAATSSSPPRHSPTPPTPPAAASTSTAPPPCSTRRSRLHDDAGLRLRRSRLRMARADLDGADADAEAALGAGAGAPALELRAWAARNRHDMESAIRLGTAGADVAEDPATLASCLLAVALAHRGLGDLPPPMPPWRLRWRPRPPPSVGVQAWVGVLRVHQGRAAEALAALQPLIGAEDSGLHVVLGGARPADGRPRVRTRRSCHRRLVPARPFGDGAAIGAAATFATAACPTPIAAGCCATSVPRSPRTTHAPGSTPRAARRSGRSPSSTSPTRCVHLGRLDEARHGARRRRRRPGRPVVPQPLAGRAARRRDRRPPRLSPAVTPPPHSTPRDRRRDGAERGRRRYATIARLVAATADARLGRLRRPAALAADLDRLPAVADAGGMVAGGRRRRRHRLRRGRAAAAATRRRCSPPRRDRTPRRSVASSTAVSVDDRSVTLSDDDQLEDGGTEPLGTGGDGGACCQPSSTARAPPRGTVTASLELRHAEAVADDQVRFVEADVERRARSCSGPAAPHDVATSKQSAGSCRSRAWRVDDVADQAGGRQPNRRRHVVDGTFRRAALLGERRCQDGTAARVTLAISRRAAAGSATWLTTNAATAASKTSSPNGRARRRR